MYKSQYKSGSAYATWTTAGTYNSEAAAISSALRKKLDGAIVVRVISNTGGIIYSN
jgi:hypothetical protein